MMTSLRKPAGLFSPRNESLLTRETLSASKQMISLRIARLLALLLVFFILPAAQVAFTSERWPVLFAFVVGVALIWYAALSSGSSYQLRTVTIVLAIYMVMAGEAAIYGLLVDALPYALLTVILTTILLNSWAGFAAVLVSGALLTIVATLTRAGVIELSGPHIEPYLNGQLWLWVSVKFVVFLPIAIYPLLWLLADTYSSLQQQRDLTQALTQEHQLLARRIATRRQALETSLEISANLSTLLDVDLLANEVVEQVGRSFDYYHVQIYLTDHSGKLLRLVGATGEAGKALLAREHVVVLGEGMVGRAAKERELLLAPDVQIDPHWIANELLPETRSEIAVPIIAADQLIGVLDVQNDQRDGLTSDDLIVLQTIANQVAIAVQNANLFQNAQRRAETVAMVNRVALNIRKESELEGVLKSAIVSLGERVNAKELAILISGDRNNLS